MTTRHLLRGKIKVQVASTNKYTTRMRSWAFVVSYELINKFFLSYSFENIILTVQTKIYLYKTACKKLAWHKLAKLAAGLWIAGKSLYTLFCTSELSFVLSRWNLKKKSLINSNYLKLVLDISIFKDYIFIWECIQNNFHDHMCFIYLSV